jgi:hypothetical protein
MLRQARNWLLLLSVPLLGFSCSKPGAPAELPYRLLAVSSGPVGSDFSMVQQDSQIHLLFSEYETLSLKLNTLHIEPQGSPPEIRDTLFLDRINHTQEIDDLFGNHSYGLYGGEQHIFYLDLEKEDKRILKWISRPRSDVPWNIDAIAATGRLVAGLREPKGRITLYLQQEEALLAASSPGFSPFREILEPFAMEGDVCRLDGDGNPGFTAYNARSGRLLLLELDGGRTTVTPLLRGGRTHYSARISSGMLGVLVYDPQKSELRFYSQNDPKSPFHAVAVTPCRGTRSVFFFSTKQGLCYLYNEWQDAENGRRSHQISLLYPQQSGYRKVAVYRSRTPIQAFRAAIIDRTLAIAFSQDALRFLVVDLGLLFLSSGS